jgi:hypothetical protein
MGWNGLRYCELGFGDTKSKKQWRVENGKTYRQIYYLKNHERECARNKEYRLTHKDYFVKKQREYYARNHEKIILRQRITTKKRNRNMKLEVLKKYSNGSMKCVKCGFSDLRALSIDHINGEGNKHRKELKIHGGGGSNFYDWLVRKNFPSGFQVLCMNCQFIKRVENNEYHRRAD